MASSNSIQSNYGFALLADSKCTFITNRAELNSPIHYHNGNKTLNFNI